MSYQLAGAIWIGISCLVLGFIVGWIWCLVFGKKDRL